MLVFFFGGAILGVGLAGGGAWLLFHSDKAFGIAISLGLVAGGFLGYVVIRNLLKTPEGGEYCHCSSDTI